MFSVAVRTPSRNPFPDSWGVFRADAGRRHGAGVDGPTAFLHWFLTVSDNGRSSVVERWSHGGPGGRECAAATSFATEMSSSSLTRPRCHFTLAEQRAGGFSEQ